MLILCFEVVSLPAVSKTLVQEPRIWFCPSGPNKGGGAQDYYSILESDRDWPTVVGAINVFKVYASFIANTPDEKLRLAFAFLRQHKIALAMEYGVITRPADCGANIEGFAQGGERNAVALATKVRQLGGELTYIAMDEPFWNGNISNEKGVCHWSPQQIAANAVETLKAVKKIFPQIAFGDIEPVRVDNVPPAQLVAAYGIWFRAWREAAGSPLAFFHSDVYWQPISNNVLAEISRVSRAAGVPFGVIYNGNVHEISSQEWLDRAYARATAYEIFSGGAPDDAVFQSWSKFPDRVAPESDPETHANLIFRYIQFEHSRQADVSDIK